MRHLRLSLIAVLLIAMPPGAAIAQDFLAPLRDAVEELMPRERPAPRPVPPPVREAEEPEETVEDEVPLPRPRPEPVEDEAAADEAEPASEDANAVMDEPVAEETPAEAAPERIYQTACPALLSGLVVGEMVPPIAEGVCGERSPLTITAVLANGRLVPFSNPVTTNCAMAGALAGWVAEVDAYAAAALDSRLETVVSGTGMMCRNRYSAADGFVSEHGFANALDVVGFALDNGKTINVEAGWLPASAPEGRFLRQAHGAACGRFTTVLGPEANADHEDHLHLDLGCHGQTCTAQICE